jgi:hypothetical protein
LQLAAITVAIIGSMFTVSEGFDDDILRNEFPEGNLKSASKELRAAARVNEKLVFGHTIFDAKTPFFRASSLLASVLFGAFYSYFLLLCMCVALRCFLG